MARRDMSQSVVSLLLTKYLRLIQLLIVLVLLVAGYLTIIGPKYTTIRQSGILDVREKQARLLDRQKYQTDLQRSVDRYKLVSPTTVEDLSRILPRDVDLPGLFVMLEALVRDVGFVPSQMSFTQERAVVGADVGAASSVLGELGVVNITMAVQGDGSYPSLVRLLSAIERNNRLIDVQTFTFNPVAALDEETAQTINLSMKTYFLVTQ